jgi:nicotinate phosphoribosyltransferase
MLENHSDLPLLVDLYELTMAAAYFEHQVKCRATFEVFVRQMPPERSYLVAGGIDDAIDYLSALRFTEENVNFLRSLPALSNVSAEFFDYLRCFRFSGDVRAVEEGTLIFAEEPLLQVTAPIMEAQIAETYLLSVINFETLVATKAARVVQAARGRGVFEFGTRRAHGPEAGVRAARAAYLGGCVATSNVLAGFRYGIPLAGTAAHSWTQAFPTERQSFHALVDTFPNDAVLLIDTYDPLAGAETAATLGRKFAGVRIDSGDLLEKSRRVREILDRHGLREVKLVASGDLNEYKIEALLLQGAPIDLFGVGTDLATSRDVPALGVVYKLVEIEQDGRVDYKTKFSEEKVYMPGRKQVYRFSEGDQYHHDLITRSAEQPSGGVPLLHPVMRDGQRLKSPSHIQDSRAGVLANLGRLPEPFQALRNAPAYPVAKSEALVRLLEEFRDQTFGHVTGA